MQSKKNHKKQKICSKNLIIEKNLLTTKNLIWKGVIMLNMILAIIKRVFKAIYYRKITIEEVEAIQEDFNGVFGALEIYGPKKPKYIKKGESFN